MMAAAQPRDAFAYFINVLVVIGIPAGPVNRALSRYAIDSSPDGVMVNVFNDVRWRRGALHDKPLALIGRSAGCYSGVWSRQVDDTRGGLGPRVMEPLTVPTLREAVKKLADEVHGGRAAAAM
jgi:hypothetical protein